MFDDLRGQIGSVISRLREFSDLRTFANWVFKRGPRGGKIWVNEKSGKETRTDPTGRGRGALSQRGGVADLDKAPAKVSPKQIKAKVAKETKSVPAVKSPPVHPHPPEEKNDYWGNKAKQPYWRPGANPTVDNVITRHNPDTGLKEVLLIQRGEGTVEGGKWALPGGFHDTKAKKGEAWAPGHETAEQAAMRELAEETGLDASELAKHMRKVGEYETGPEANERRDPRDNKEAWSKSTAFRLHLTPELAKRAVAGTDDAQDAKWVPVHEVGRMNLAFDHGKILKDAGIHPENEAKAGPGGLVSIQEAHEAADKAIQGAISELQGLYRRSTTPDLEYSEISHTVSRIAKQFHPKVLKEIAAGFGIKGGPASKEDLRRRIEGKITEQKGRWERGQRIAKEYDSGDEPNIPVARQPAPNKIDDVSLGSIEAKKPSAYEVLGIEKQDVQAERKRFKTLGLPKIRAYERRTGRPWVELVLKNMENGVAGVDKSTPYGERWERLVRGNHPGLEKVLGDPNFSHDYGSMHAQDFAKVVAMLHEQGYRPATAKTGERQAASVGRVSDLDPARFRKAFGFTPGKHDFADLLSRLHAFSEAALHRFDWEPFRTRKGTTAARDTDTGRKAYGKKAASLLNRKHRTPRPIEEPGHDRGQAGAPDTASIPASEIPLPLSRRRRAWNQAVALGKAIAAKAASAKAHGKRIGQAAMEKLPEPAQKIVHGALKVSSLKQEAANRVVRAVIKERGLSDEHADKVIGWTSAVDFVAGWAAKMTTLGLIRNVPLGSFGYLLVSTAQNPLATLRTAKQGIGAAIAKIRDEATEAITDPDHPYPMIFSDVPKEPDSAMKLYASKILDAAHKFGPEGLDAYMACVMAGVDEGLAGEELFKVADYMMSHDRVL